MNYFLLLFLLVTPFIHAKSSDFSVVVNKPFDSAIFDITQDYNRQISAVGFSKNYNASVDSFDNTYTNAFEYLQSVSSKHGSQMHLIRVNSSARITLSKAINLSYFAKAVAVIKTPQDGYLLGGYTDDGSLNILKLKSNGNIIFNKKFGTKNYDKMNNLIKLKDGGVLAVGSSTTSRSHNDNLFQAGLGLNDIYLTRFSKNGTKLWSKKFGTQYDDKGVDAVEASDGSIVVLSSTYYDKNKNITLMRVTENGNKIWLKHYKSKDTITPHKIIKLKDNNFLISLSQQDNMQKEQIRLIKFDLQKNVLIDKEVPTTYSSVLKDIKEYSNSNLIAVGYVNDTSNTDALVMLLDNKLNLQHQEHYGGKNLDMFNAVTILHNSQAAAAGIYTNENSQESNMWIVKLNTDASIAQVLTKQTNFNKQLAQLFKKEIQDNKLIIKKDLSISFTDKSLYFKTGKYILTKKQKAFLAKFSKKLIPFLKTNQEFINTLEINGHTSSEWKNTTFTNRYLNNEKLSMNRSYEVFGEIFKTQNKPTQIWLTKILKGSGYNYSKKTILNGNENKEKSRRVSLKIILN